MTLSTRTWFSGAGVCFIAALSLFLWTGTAAAVTRNRDAEQFVERHATEALAALGDKSADEARVRQVFSGIVIELADIPKISTFVLGTYAVRLRQEPQLAREWADAFQAFTVANYADRLKSYSGSVVRATGSIERVPNQDVIVRSELTSDPSRPPRVIQWRMLRAGTRWKVADIALVLDGNEVWLAQQQRAQFTSILGRNHGDVRALIANVRQTTGTIETVPR